MGAKTPSSSMRQLLRAKIRDRIDIQQITQADAGAMLGLTPAQVSRLMRDEDIFTLDRLVDVAARVGFSTRLHVTRPYQRG